MSYIYNLADTWNAGATTFTAIKMNVTDTASDAASSLMDLQIGSATQFKVSKSGSLFVGGQTYAGVLAYDVNTLGLRANGGAGINIGQGFIRLATSLLQWGADFNSGDATISRRGAANLRFGAADAAAPVAQTLSVQSVVAGTTNTAGANFTLTGSQGTGTGAGGSLVFQVAPAGSTGTAQNTLVSFAELTSTRAFRLYNTADVTTNYERGFARWSAANLFQIGTENAGSGSVRSMEIDSSYQLTLHARSGAGMYFATNNVFRWYFDGAAGHLLAYADNTYDIGASSATRPRNVYAGTSITPGAGVVVASLPTPSTGMIARVTNALAPAIGSTVAGGGAAQALVWYNGANWTVIGV